MSIIKSVFGTLPSGEEIELYSITNANGMQVNLMTFGANLVNLYLPDGKGGKVDVNLGYDVLEKYTKNTDNFGATIGPNANRIGNACFELDGVKINLPKNDGENNLHTDGDFGMHKKIWKASTIQNQVIFELSLKDGELCLPGNRKFRLTYELTDDNELKLHYEVTSDRNTLINMTNHSYFNLDGHGAGSIHNHKLWVSSSAITPVVKGAIPTGEYMDVTGTVFDFRTKRQLGEALAHDDAQLSIGGGIDHNFVIDDYDGSLKKIATLSSDESGRSMDVYTNLPGIQVYTGNFIGEQIAKEGATYNKRYGVAMETQFFPDAPNHDNFPSDIFGPDREYDYTTVYRFAW